MTPGESVKACTVAPPIVAVISSAAAFHHALFLRPQTDFFELRLDALCPILPEVERMVAGLGAPLIITARHPLEGGMNNLSPARRRGLLLQFLPKAAYVDVELRSVRELRAVLGAAQKLGVKRIISVHHTDRAVSAIRLERLLESAQTHAADIVKIVTRTETAEELARLVQFFAKNKKRIAISAMGAGVFGRKARLKLALAGSVLNYVHLGAAQLEGQLSLAEMRQWLNGG